MQKTKSQAKKPKPESVHLDSVVSIELINSIKETAKKNAFNQWLALISAVYSVMKNPFRESMPINDIVEPLMASIKRFDYQKNISTADIPAILIEREIKAICQKITTEKGELNNAPVKNNNSNC